MADGMLRGQDVGKQNSMQYHKLSKTLITLHQRL